MVQLSLACGSSSSFSVGFSMAFWTSIFAWSKGDDFPRFFFLIQNQCLTGRQANSPVFQSISGLCSFSQGKPRMILCFPNMANMSLVCRVFPLTVRFSSMNEVIFPCLFLVLSMFWTTRGLSSFCIGRFKSFA